MYIPNASPNAMEPNATYIPLACMGACVGCAAICVKCAAICVGCTRVSDTNMLVSPTRNSRVGGSRPTQGPNTIISRCSGI